MRENVHEKTTEIRNKNHRNNEMYTKFQGRDSSFNKLAQQWLAIAICKTSA
jgi:hypothetical protein